MWGQRTFSQIYQSNVLVFTIFKDGVSEQKISSYKTVACAGIASNLLKY